MSHSRTLLAAVLLLATPALGCKIISAIIELPSDISAGSSRSIAGSFDALSTSSQSGEGTTGTTSNKLSYDRDLRAFTAAFAGGSGSREDFLRGVSRIAEDHGISHWEADPSTPRAIGAGLHDAGWSEPQMAEFMSEAGRDTPAAQLALDGYRQAGG